VGASTFAAAIALRAASIGGRVALIDADPVGGGLDVTLACEDAPGARWRTFAQASGHLDSAGVASALPEVAGVRLLSHDREPGGAVRPTRSAIHSVTDALVRGHDLVVADVCRQPLPERDALIERADDVFVIVSGRVRSVAAAMTLLADLRSIHHKPPQLMVARGSERSLGAARIADSIGADLAGEWLRDQVLSDELESGSISVLLDPRRGGLVRAAESVATSLLRPRAVA